MLNERGGQTESKPIGISICISMAFRNDDMVQAASSTFQASQMSAGLAISLLFDIWIELGSGFESKTMIGMNNASIIDWE